MDFRKIMDLIRFCSEYPRSYCEVSAHCRTSVRNARRWIEFVENNCLGLTVSRQLDGRRMMVQFVGLPRIKAGFNNRDLLQLASLAQSAEFLETQGRTHDANVLRDTLQQMIANVARQPRMDILARVGRVARPDQMTVKATIKQGKDEVLLDELRLAAMHGREVELDTMAGRIAGRILSFSHSQLEGWRVELTGGAVPLAEVHTMRGVEDIVILQSMAA